MLPDNVDIDGLPVALGRQGPEPLSGSSINAFGVSVGTYKAQLDGNSIDVWCVDFLNHVSAGQTYQVNLSSLGYTPDLSHTRFGTLGNQPAKYHQAVWLAGQFNGTAATSASWGAIHAAIWHLMMPGNPQISGSTQPALRADSTRLKPTTSATPTATRS